MINLVNYTELKIDESEFPAKEYSFIDNITKISKSKGKLIINKKFFIFCLDSRIPFASVSNYAQNPKIDTSNVGKNHYLSLNSVLVNKPKKNSNDSNSINNNSEINK